MPTVYAGLNTLHAKAEVSCFKLKGEDFHTKQCQVEVDGIINGCKTSTTIAVFAVFDGHGGKRAADFANKQVCELHGVGVQPFCVIQVHAHNEGQSCSSEQADIAPNLSMFGVLHTQFHIIILVCL
jgi:hypothetical protein